MSENPSDRGANRLEVASQKRREAAGLRTRRAAAEQQFQAAQQRLDEAVATLASERTDVQKLETLTWTRILSSAKGDRWTDLDREKAEERAAELVVREAEARVNQARREVQSIQSQLDALGNADAEYRAALQAEETRLVATGADQSSRLTQVAERLGIIEAELKETQEALAAGQEARERLKSAATLLDSARTWSTIDLIGGGILADMAKYRRLDNVAAELRVADHALAAFNRELGDVGLASAAGVQIDSFTTTFDVVFDNVFSDWAVGNRIKEAGERVVALHAQVVSTLNTLTMRRESLANEIGLLRAERERVLTNGS